MINAWTPRQLVTLESKLFDTIDLGLKLAMITMDPGCLSVARAMSHCSDHGFAHCSFTLSISVSWDKQAHARTHTHTHTHDVLINLKRSHCGQLTACVVSGISYPQPAT